jgi:hypothetical protein
LAGSAVLSIKIGSTLFSNHRINFSSYMIAHASEVGFPTSSELGGTGGEIDLDDVFNGSFELLEFFFDDSFFFESSLEVEVFGGFFGSLFFESSFEVGVFVGFFGSFFLESTD